MRNQCKYLFQSCSLGRSNSSRSNPLLKSSSSLDSSFGIGPSMGTGYKRAQSPFSSNSDITHFLASTYGRNIMKSPTSTNIADAFLAKDKQRTTGGDQLSNMNISDKLTKSSFADEIKNIQQKIMDELKTGEQTAGSLSRLNELKQSKEFESHNRMTFGQSNYSGTKFPYQTRRDLYDDRFGRRNASETRINSLTRYCSSLANTKNNLPFKSYEYESLNPVRYSDNKYRLTRPMSSVSYYENDLGLRESLIPNCMNSNDELFIRSSLVCVANNAPQHNS